MDIEIISVEVNNGIVFIMAIDVSDENLRRMERLRDDAAEKEVLFKVDSHNEKDYKYLRKWLKEQKATEESETWGEALKSIIGTITTIAPRYRSWE